MIEFLFSDAVRRDPYPWYAELRRASPVARDSRTGIWMVFTYDEVRQALRDHERFSSAVAPADSLTARWMIFADGPRHARLRALIARAFTPHGVEALAPRIRELARTLLDRIVPAGRLDLVDDFSQPLPLMVIAEMLGASAEDHPQIRRWSDAILQLGHAAVGTPEGEVAARAFRVASEEMRPYLAELVRRRRGRPRDDLLSRLVHAEVEGARLDDDDILAFFQLLLVAGHETTTNLISNVVLTLLDRPELVGLVADADARRALIEEVLRHRAPVQAMWRVARRDVTLGGERIAAGSLVLPMIGAANRDPAVFDAPDEVRVGRAPNPHLAFGHGIHHCIGAPLARLEASIALDELYSRLPALCRAEREPWEPRRALHVHGPAHLALTFAPAPAGV